MEKKYFDPFAKVDDKQLDAVLKQKSAPPSPLVKGRDEYEREAMRLEREYDKGNLSILDKSSEMAKVGMG